MRFKYPSIAALTLFFLTVTAPAADYIHGVSIRTSPLYIAPDSSAAKLGEIGRGREVVILEKIRGWLHVQSNVAAIPSEERIVSGWIVDKGVVLPGMQGADKVIYGEAVDSEDEASRRHGRRGADVDALRLYYRIYDMFPTSPLAAESLYRAADIRWQLDKADIMSKPSAREQEAYLRGEINDQLMKLVIKKFPSTKWADMAAFSLLDNKLCGDWQGMSKCPNKEADLYEKYASEHPQSPKTAEALYDAAWRYSALIQIYKTEEQDSKKSEEAKSKALAAAQRVVSQYADTDWGARAQRLIFMVQQDIPTYGNATE